MDPFAGLNNVHDDDEDGLGEEEKSQAIDKQLECCAVNGDSTSESESDSESEQLKEIKKQMKTKKVRRNADLFESPDPAAGQMFVLVGKSEKGKTHFMKWLLFEQLLRPINPMKFGLVFVSTKFKHSWNFMPDDKVYEGLDEEVLRKYISNLRTIYEETQYLPPSFIVFEDLIGVLNNRNPWFQNFMSSFRHLNITLFITAQYLTGHRAISPLMRNQTTHAIMFSGRNFGHLKNLYEAYGQQFRRVRDFSDYLLENTDKEKVGPHVAIVYIEREDDPEKNLLPMRAPAKLPKIKKLKF